MLILLPPSEGKTPATHGVSVDLGDMSFPVLTEAREVVVDELVRVSAGVDGAVQLKVGKSLVAEVERNTRLLVEPAAPAAEVYSGVLFEAFGFGSLSKEAQARAVESVLVVSALWGAVSLADRIPAYRLSMGVKLGECGDLARFWAGELARPLGDFAAGQLVIDCRSATYAKAWTPEPGSTFSVRVERVAADGSRKVVSHMAKHYRGLLARFLVEHNLTGVEDIDELLPCLAPAFEVELTHPTSRKPGTLTLLVRD